MTFNIKERKKAQTESSLKANKLITLLYAKLMQNCLLETSAIAYLLKIRIYGIIPHVVDDIYLKF